MVDTEVVTPSVSAWLSETVDSHGIYAVSLLSELPAPVTFDPGTSTLHAPERPAIRLYTRTMRTLLKAQGAFETGDAKGAYADEDTNLDEVVFGGYELSGALDRLLTGEDGGGAFMGRGSAHRARIRHIHDAGF